jgi:hypothetical protein
MGLNLISGGDGMKLCIAYAGIVSQDSMNDKENYHGYSGKNDIPAQRP